MNKNHAMNYFVTVLTRNLCGSHKTLRLIHPFPSMEALWPYWPQVVPSPTRSTSPRGLIALA